MKTKMLLSALLIGLIMSAVAQHTLELTFTAIDSAAYAQLDSIKVMNRSQGGDTVLYYPDTILVLEYQVGISENSGNTESFQVFQNYPNPVSDQTTVSLNVPSEDKVSITVTDILGRTIIQSERVLVKGKHFFRFTPGSGNLCFFTARWKGQSSSIKILRSGVHSGGLRNLEYTGIESFSSQLKTIKDIRNFSFSSGDELLYIGYAGPLQSGRLDIPEESTTYAFQFATNIPCPGTPTVTYEGQVYNTIQIFSQCWLKENLNVGVMIPSNQEMEDNDTIEKYCYNNNTAFCDNYGGLYKWNEMMQYTTQKGAQGICPPGWHLPMDEEWKVLEGAADSQYRMGSQIWDTYGLRGYDAGTKLKSASLWIANGNGTDMFGFSGLPGGYIFTNNHFYYLGQHGLWWSSTEGNSTSAWNRYFSYNNPKVDRDYGNNKGFGFSVRCIQD